MKNDESSHDKKVYARGEIIHMKSSVCRSLSEEERFIGVVNKANVTIALISSVPKQTVQYVEKEQLEASLFEE